jgi:peptidoglycan/LPS O-acetylase OafA/YrhL
LQELDSIRGLAALSVVLLHFTGIWEKQLLRGASPQWRHRVDFLAMPLTAGNQAVILFFVLSGFVLSIPAIESRAQTYPVFITRRIFRIYMPYLAALLLAILGNNMFYGHGDPCQCLDGAWSAPVTWRPVVHHLLFLGRYDTDVFDLPIWTLVYEMRISLVFPFLCAIALRLKPFQSLALAASISGAATVASALLHSDAADALLFTTAHYASLFVVGICLARQRQCIGEAFVLLSRRQKNALAVLSAVLYFYGGIFWLLLIRRFADSGWDYVANWFTAAGAAGFLAFGLNSARCKRILRSAPIRILGKMSYSVYLLHYIVVLTLVHWLYGKLPLLPILVICFPVTLVASWVFHRGIERPFTQLGRRLSRRLQPEGISGSIQRVVD